MRINFQWINLHFYLQYSAPINPLSSQDKKLFQQNFACLATRAVFGEGVNTLFAFKTIIFWFNTYPESHHLLGSMKWDKQASPLPNYLIVKLSHDMALIWRKAFAGLGFSNKINYISIKWGEYRPWWLSGLELVSNSSRHSLEDPGSNPCSGLLYQSLRSRNT